MKIFDQPLVFQDNLTQCPGDAAAHQAGNSAADEGFNAQFGEVPPLVGRQLADTAYLYTDGGKVRKAAKRISGYQQRFRVLYHLCALHFAQRLVGDKFVQHRFFAQQLGYGSVTNQSL